ncbi:MAG: InlB B-repeat-containing protein, partial [Bacteroidaceae bacterium]|nr:InlB B-repeat-containing protein [Bacteroidaceae bacterium]
ISATANEGYRFVGWKDGTSGNMVSTNATYTFTANTNSTIIAVFAELPVLRVNLGIASSSQGVSNVQGGGIKEQGDSVSCSCTVGENINFLGWFDNASGSGSPVSTANPYTFTMGNESISLWAKGETIGEDGIE